MRKPFINNQIRAKEVRVIDEEGKQLGLLTLENALNMAREKKMDLIQVTDKVDPPVCKITDYGKYLYHLQKKEKNAGKHKVGELKGIRLTFVISEHDMEIRANLAEKFLKIGDKVRIEMPLRGREKALQGFAREKMLKFVEILKKLTPVKIEKELKREPRGLSIILSSLKDKS